MSAWNYMALLAATEALVAEILGDSRASDDKLQILTQPALCALGDSLQLNPESSQLHWSAEFVSSLASFARLCRLLADLLPPTEGMAEPMVLQALARCTQGTSLKPALLPILLWQWLEAVRCRQVTYRLSQRVLGLDMACPILQLNSEVRLVRLSDEEFSQRLPSLETLQYGWLGAEVSPWQRVEVQVTRSQELLEVSSFPQGPRRRQDWLNLARRVREALLLLKPESQVELGHPFFFWERPDLGMCPEVGASQRMLGNGVANLPSLLQPEELEELQGCFEVACRVQSHPPLSAGLHRYALAGTRSRPEDSLVDLVVGFEALLLQGTQNELSHRFSLNGSSLSHWIYRSPRLASYRLFRDAYGARSSLVHGYGSRLKRTRLQTLNDELRHLLSGFIRWLVVEAPSYGFQPRLQAEDWLRLLFESPPELGTQSTQGS